VAKITRTGGASVQDDELAATIRARAQLDESRRRRDRAVAQEREARARLGEEQDAERLRWQQGATQRRVEQAESAKLHLANHAITVLEGLPLTDDQRARLRALGRA
jgi:hypothetical protein